MAFLLCVTLLVNVSHGATYKLADGKEVTGELLPSSATDAGIQIKTGDGQYERVLWGNFSQSDLKTLVTDQKLRPFVEPFIEITREERLQQTKVTIKQPQRLELPPSGSLIGAMVGSSLGLFVLVALWAATIYAGYEVALFRGQSPILVAGLAAIPGIGILSPIIFLSMPTKMKPTDAQEATAASEPSATAAAAAGATGESVNPMQDLSVAHPSALHLHHEEKKKSTTAIPQPVVYQRGQFTFNRRFFETKFVNFFGAVRRAEDRDMVLVIKASRGRYTGQRISRIAANDLHLEVHHGATSEEVMIPFVEIQEIRVQHKDQQ